MVDQICVNSLDWGADSLSPATLVTNITRQSCLVYEFSFMSFMSGITTQAGGFVTQN